MFWFALKTLLSDRGKALTALVGVVFSLVLINIQGGLYFGLIGKASLLVDHCDADVWVGHRGVENVDLPDVIPSAWLNRVRGLPGVADVQPYLLASAGMTLSNGEFEPVWIVGSDRTSLLGSAWTLNDQELSALRRPDSIIVDATDDAKLAHPQVGDVVEVNGHRAQIVAKTDGIQNFMTTPVVFTTLGTAHEYTGVPPGYCSYLLVRADSAVDPRNVAAGIRTLIPESDVFTSREFRQVSQDYWMRRTGIGLSFGTATVLGLLVGFLMVMQSLYALALDHLPEYAALKAIGANDRQVSSVVTRQALCIAAAGAAIGVGCVLVMQRVISSPIAPITIPGELLGGSVAVVFGICLASTFLPLLRIRRVDPAIVLQG
jgi:putative ABC transport system permease protein